MANCLEITLWYPEDKFNALSTALEPAGSSVEEELGRVLTELYERLVPSEQRVEIAEKLAAAPQQQKLEKGGGKKQQGGKKKKGGSGGSGNSSAYMGTKK